MTNTYDQSSTSLSTIKSAKSSSSSSDSSSLASPSTPASVSMNAFLGRRAFLRLSGSDGGSSSTSYYRRELRLVPLHMISSVSVGVVHMLGVSVLVLQQHIIYLEPFLRHLSQVANGEAPTMNGQSFRHRISRSVLLLEMAAVGSFRSVL